MGSLSGIIQRPLIAAAAVAVASASADVSDKFQSFTSPGAEQTDSSVSVSNSIQEFTSSWVSHISVSKLSSLNFVTRVQVPVPSISFGVPSSGHKFIPTNLCSSVASFPLLVNAYQSAELAKASKPTKTTAMKSRTVVVLLGWLGAKQKHLRKYAEWYTSKGFHVITFTFPMAEILSYQVGGKAEQNIELLVNHLADCLEDEGKNLVFHTFSNTGWLTYGAILEKFQNKDPSLMGRIRGCIVDSAPVASPDPQVWASGFSAAFLKKNSVATKGIVYTNELETDELVGSRASGEPKPAVTETALLVVLEKFFEVILHLPAVNRRLSDVLGLLSSGQPACPQLYIYSSADRVIPAESVESFIEEQRKAGREVRACNFVSTPHVDHFRNDPKLYTTQLSQFLEDYVVTCCKSS
ncbi:transmembrane protein 53 [Citrus sinensis]|uniref:Transmembrane protein 53 n=1 Tax=Citrus sinensis TaxID=2711 RepID=A0ACB8LE87_CITSI|nr:transmembrane protein 53 [Citrus sinensis]